MYICYIHTIFNLYYQQYRHSMAVPSVTNAQGQVSVIHMQWSPEAGAKGTFDQADHSTYIVLAIFIKKQKQKQKKNTYFTVSFICI